MTTYSIRPVALCEGPRDSSQYTYPMNPGTRCTSVCYLWYIEGSQPKTIVDAGATVSTFTERGITEVGLMPAEDSLGKLGLMPKDIGIVIVTHLHFDHIELGYLYKEARFIVQKRELDYARNPHPTDNIAYDRSMFEDLDLEVVDGQREIIPGVSVFPTSGHSPGGQSVEVNTLAGKAIITGFCCALSTFEQTEEMKHKGWEVVVPFIHHDVREAYDSVLEVKRRADVIIALHDSSFAGKERIP